MITDKNVLKSLSFLLSSHCLPILSQLSFSFSSLLSSIVPLNQFSYPLIKSFFLLFVYHSAHLVSLVIIKIDVFKVQSVLGLVVIWELFFGIQQFLVEILIVCQIIHFLFCNVPCPYMFVFLSLFFNTSHFLVSCRVALHTIIDYSSILR